MSPTEDAGVQPRLSSLALQPLAATTPLVSIVIPVRNEEALVDQCIRSLKALDYPADRLEILFADGRSTDRTVEIVRSHGLTVIDNPGLTVAGGRNAGYAAARGELVAFTDADCLFDPQWVRRAVGYFCASDVAGLSGPTRVPENQDAFGTAVGILFDLAGMAGGTVHFSEVPEARPIDDLPGCNAFYRREALDTVMPMDTVLRTNEDVEMNAALRKQGFRFLMTPDVRVFHYKRSSPIRFWRQMHAFALGRGCLGRRDRTFLSPSHWCMGVGLPLVLLVCVAAACVKPVLWAAGGVALIAVLLATLLFFTVRASLRVAAYVALAAVLFVSAWPLGFVRGFVFAARQQVPDASGSDAEVQR